MHVFCQFCGFLKYLCNLTKFNQQPLTKAFFFVSEFQFFCSTNFKCYEFWGNILERFKSTTFCFFIKLAHFTEQRSTDWAKKHRLCRLQSVDSDWEIVRTVRKIVPLLLHQKHFESWCRFETSFLSCMSYFCFELNTNDFKTTSISQYG